MCVCEAQGSDSPGCRLRLKRSTGSLPRLHTLIWASNKDCSYEWSHTRLDTPTARSRRTTWQALTTTVVVMVVMMRDGGENPSSFTPAAHEWYLLRGRGREGGSVIIWAIYIYRCRCLNKSLKYAQVSLFAVFESVSYSRSRRIPLKRFFCNLMFSHVVAALHCCFFNVLFDLIHFNLFCLFLSGFCCCCCCFLGGGVAEIKTGRSACRFCPDGPGKKQLNKASFHSNSIELVHLKSESCCTFGF